MKRTLSILLALCMLLSAFAFSAAAENELNAIITSIASGDTFESGENIVLTASANAADWSHIDFYANGRKIPGAVENGGTDSIIWYAPSAGSYTVVPVITHIGGAVTNGEPAAISVKSNDITDDLSVTASIPDGSTDVCNELSKVTFNFSAAIKNTENAVTVYENESPITEGITFDSGIDYIDVCFADGALAYGKTYKLSLSDAVTDLNNTSFGGKTISFTTVSDNCTNVKPVVSVTYPADGAAAPLSAKLAAKVIFASNVTKVEFFDGEASLGEAKKLTENEYQLDNANLSAGEHNIKAVATYAAGRSESSFITVNAAAATSYMLKGLSNGDRFAANSLYENTMTRNVKITDEAGNTASNIKKAEIRVNGEKKSTVTNADFDLPMINGENNLTVVITDQNDNVSVLTYTYACVFVKYSDNSTILDFDDASAGSEMDEPNITKTGNDDITYAADPDASRTGNAIVLTRNISDSATSSTVLEMKKVDISSAEMKYVIFEADVFIDEKESSIVNMQCRDRQSTILAKDSSGVLLNYATSIQAINRWKKFTFEIDFDNMVYRRYVDGKFDYSGAVSAKGTLDPCLKITNSRYGDAKTYFDNIKVAACEPITDVTPEYAVKGIADGSRFPVGTDSESLKRTIYIANSDASGFKAANAANLVKTEYYIDNNLAATVIGANGKWNLPLDDLNQHTLKIAATDALGGTQVFGPYNYSAVYMDDSDKSIIETFDGAEGDAVALENASRMAAATNVSQTAVYGKPDGYNGMAMLLSQGSAIIATNEDINIVPDSIVSVSLDFYGTKTTVDKLHLYMRNSNGYNLKEGEMAFLSGFANIDSNYDMNKWHHMAFEFDLKTGMYRGLLDGYEFESGNVDTRVAARDTYFQLTAQRWSPDPFYIDNLKVCVKETAASEVKIEKHVNGNSFSFVAVNPTSEDLAASAFWAVYDSENNLVDVSLENLNLNKGQIKSLSKEIPLSDGQTAKLIIMDSNLGPLG